MSITSKQTKAVDAFMTRIDNDDGPLRSNII